MNQSQIEQERVQKITKRGDSILLLGEDNSFIVPNSKSVWSPFGESYTFYDYWNLTHPHQDIYETLYKDYEPLGEELMEPLNWAVCFKNTLYQMAVGIIGISAVIFLLCK